MILDTYRFTFEKSGILLRAFSSKKEIELAKFEMNRDQQGSLKLGYDYRYRKEGEFVLSFDVEALGGRIVAAAFSFEETAPQQWACRIGCVQGHEINMGNLSKTVQKLMYGLRPKAFVVFALQEMVRNLGCGTVYGAGDAIQAYRRKHAIHLQRWHAIPFNYDALWKETGGQQGADGWFELPVISKRKALSEVKSQKRSQYRKRYKLMDEVAEKTARTMGHKA